MYFGGIDEDITGKFSIITNSVNEVEIRLEIKNSLIKAEAETGNVCSLYLTEFGDMRSFIVPSDVISYGSSSPLVQDFDCLDTENIGDLTRVYSLSKGSFINVEDSAVIVGKGLLLRNVSKDKTISYGIMREATGFIPALDTSVKDIVAICLDPKRFSVLFFSQVDLDE